MRVVTLALAVAATLQVAACGTAPPPLMRSPTVFRSTSAGRVPARLSLRGGGALEISTTCDQTNMGECVGIVGDGHALGNWKNPRRVCPHRHFIPRPPLSRRCLQAAAACECSGTVIRGCILNVAPTGCIKGRPPFSNG